MSEPELGTATSGEAEAAAGHSSGPTGPSSGATGPSSGAAGPSSGAAGPSSATAETPAQRKAPLVPLAAANSSAVALTSFSKLVSARRKLVSRGGVEVCALYGAVGARSGFKCLSVWLWGYDVVNGVGMAC